MISAAMFIVVMDVLKYYFGIDPVRDELKQGKQSKKKKPAVVIRLIYVNAPPVHSSASSISIVEKIPV
jgi:hypothetical protein